MLRSNESELLCSFVIVLLVTHAWIEQKVVEALMIILALFELLYLLSLHLGFGRAGHNTHAGAPGVGMGGMGGHNHQHHTDYGHHTDMKIPVGHVANPAHPGY